MTHILRTVVGLIVTLAMLAGPVALAGVGRDGKKPAPKAAAKPGQPKQPTDKPKAPAQPAVKKPAPPTHTVKKEHFRIELNLKGVFEAQQTREYALRPEAWAQFKVLKAAPHGARVKKGDVLVQFESKYLDQAIDDIAANQAMADLEYQAAQEELNYLEEAVPFDMASAERAKKYADEDLKHYFEVDLPLARRVAKQNVKQYEDYLSYEKEELRQLQKMYKADDLTEETEEIILKRQHDTIDRLMFFLERTKVTTDHQLQTLLPREEVAAKYQRQFNDLKLRVTRTQLPRMLVQKRLSVQKMTRDRQKATEQLKRMKRDRGRMTIRAGADGVVYYGQANRGQFVAVQQMQAMLKPGSVIKPGTVLLTLVRPRPLSVRTSMPEASLHRARPGIAGNVTPTGFPDTKLNAKLKQVAAVPMAPGTFDATAEVDAGKGAERVMPGMTCSIKLVAYEKADALTVPDATVHRDNDSGPHYVYVQLKDGKHKKQNVTVGQKNGGKTEIVRGLKEGDKVLLKKPDGK